MPKIFKPFEEAFAFVIEMEAGFSFDKDDPGGATNYGITLATARENGLDIDGDGDVDVDDIKTMTINNAFIVYKNKYWDPLFNNAATTDLSWDVAFAAFDAAVNCGINRAKGWLNTALKNDNPVKTINTLRRIHYANIIHKNPKLSKFKRGWENRVNNLEKQIDILRRDLDDGMLDIRAVMPGESNYH